MKKLLLALFLIPFFGNSQNLAFQWAKSVSGSGPEVGYGLTMDGSGNVYSTGSFSGTTDFDPGIATVTVASLGAEDIYVSKLDVSGNFVWTKTFGGTGSDVARSITSDASGNVYVTGYFSGTIDFDPGAAVYNLTSSGGLDIFVLKLNSAGNFVNAFSVGGVSGTDVARSIAVDASSNIYLTGYYFGVADFDPGVGTATLSASAGFDIFIAKYTSAGAITYARSVGGTATTEMGTSLKVDATGNVYVGGYFSGTGDFDPGVGTFTMTTSVGSQDLFIIKLNASGNFVWAKQIGNTSSTAIADLALDGIGNVLATGSFFGTVDFDPGAGIANLTEAGTGMGDCFILKLDATGNYIWATSLGSTSSDGGAAIRTDASNNIYTTGSFQATVDFDPGVGVYNLTATSSDIFISKLNASGNFLAAVKFGGSAVDIANSIAVDASNNVYTTGSFNTTPDFDPGSPVFNITSAGSTDAFVHKLFPCLQPALPANTTSSTNLSICPNQNTTLNATGSGTVSWFASPTSTTVLSSGVNFITPTLSVGTYTYYAEAFTCMNSASRTAVTVTVNPPPTITVNSGTICNGSSYTVVPSGANTYSYMNSTTGSSCVTSPILSNTNFSLIGTSAAGCTNTATCFITSVSLPIININSSTGGPSLCSGSSATLFAGGASTYTWVSGPNTFTYAISPTVLTTYTVVGTSSLGCSSSNTISMGILTTPTINISVSSPSICNGNSTTLNASGATSYVWNTSATTSSISVSPTTTTIYTVTGTILSCTATKTISINVTANPSISINASSNSICTGGSTTLSIIGSASSYSWNTGPTTTSIVVSPTASTSYTAAGFNGSCYGLATTSITISTSITLNVSSSSPSICVGQSATLTANGASTYTWNTGSNAISIVVTPTTSTSYSVNGSSGSCNGSAITSISVNLCTGIRENVNAVQFSIYPNPSRDNIIIEVENLSDLQILDVLGKIVLETSLQKQNNTINISQLNNGIYYFKIKQGGTNIIKKVIKQ